jgi:hypothetical protein
MPAENTSPPPALLTESLSEGVAKSSLSLLTAALQAVVTDLRAVHQTLDDPPDAQAMAEGEIAESLSFQLRAVIESVITDNLGPAIESLGEAAITSAERLHREWQEREGRRP